VDGKALAEKYANSHWMSLFREYWPFFLLIIPVLIITVAFIFVPVIYAVTLSFFKMETIVSPGKFVGIGNYREIFSDPLFWNALKNGVIYAISTVALQLIIGIGIALILDQNFKGRNYFRGLAIVPYVIPTVVASFTWLWILDPNVGIVNKVIKGLGLGTVTWFETPLTAMFSTVLVSVWIWTPFVTLTFLAGLQGIDQELHEAARVDGATWTQRFLFITLPLLKPILVIIVLLRTSWMFNKFDIIWLLTQGGPLHATEHLPVLAYLRAFRMFEVGNGAGIATVSFLLLIVLIFIYLKRVNIDE
jgi:multiple sugar transport system permease protein